MATTDDEPRVLRDIPMGRQGTRGRLLVITPDAGGRHRFVFYRGTCTAARAAVAGCPLGELRDLHERQQDIERRAAANKHLDYALAQAIDLPAIDPEVRRIIAYLEGSGS